MLAIIRVCAWCALFMGVKLPLERWEMTHGICRPCCLRGDVWVSPPSVRGQPRSLLILPRRVPPVSAHLAIPALAYLEPTTVIWDRRYGDRRQGGKAATPERRQCGASRGPGPFLILAGVFTRPLSRDAPEQRSA